MMTARRADETYLKVNGHWCYLSWAIDSWAIDRDGNLVEVLRPGA